MEKLSKTLMLLLLLLSPAFLAYSQAPLSLDQAIENSANYLQGRFPRGTRAAILAMQSDDPDVTDYAIRRISSVLVNRDWFTVLERNAAVMDILSRERDYHLSGYVSDETALSIGRELGAEIIITAAMVYGQVWQLDIRASWVETRQLAGQYSTANIRPDSAWASLASPRSPAQLIDHRIRDAVNTLASRLNSPMELSIGRLTLSGTDTSSEFSRYLYTKINHHAVNNNQFRVVAPTRSFSPPQSSMPRATISGSFSIEGNMVAVFLQLVSDSNNISLGSERFLIQMDDLIRIPIEILPANVRSQDEAKRHEEIFNPPVPVNSNPAFRIEAWPNSSSYTFFNGDELQINLISNQDCFFKVYHIDVDSKVQMIYPNARNRNNRLQANVARTIPDPGILYRIQAPFGQDSIVVVASAQQFENLEAEFAAIEQATQNTIGVLMSGRGLGMEIAEPGSAVQTVSARFNFTSLPSNSVLRNPDF